MRTGSRNHADVSCRTHFFTTMDEFHAAEGLVKLLGRTGLYVKLEHAEYYIDSEMGLAEKPNLVLYQDSVTSWPREHTSSLPAATRHLIATQAQTILVNAGVVVYFF